MCCFASWSAAYLASPWWRYQMETFSALLALCAGIHRSPVNFPHKGLWHAALMFPLICAWINGWVNNCGGGDLRRHCAHYDVIVMTSIPFQFSEALYDDVYSLFVDWNPKSYCHHNISRKLEKVLSLSSCWHFRQIYFWCKVQTSKHSCNAT